MASPQQREHTSTSASKSKMASVISPGSSPTPSESTLSEKSNLAEPVKKCIRALEAAQTDTEKFAALFIIPKLVKGTDCDHEARMLLMKGIGYSFIARMLRSKDSPDGCPKLMYQSVALSVLSCFTSEEEIMTHPSILFNLPIMMDIINNADSEAYEENLLIIQDAYRCLIAIVATVKGRNAFISNRGVHYLCEINIRQSFQCEDALKMLLYLLNTSGHICWSYYSGPEDFNNLMLKFCKDFSVIQDETKFEMCDTIKTIIRSYPKAIFDDEPWLPLLQKGLHDILFSKITKKQRDPAIMLVAAVIEVSDFEWCLTEDETNPERGRFFLIILNLACIEVIMHLEEQDITEIMVNSELLVACYYIIESAVSYMASDRLLLLDQRQRGQLYTALKNGFATIVKFLLDCSLMMRQHPEKFESPQTKYFVCATIRILGAWLSEETMAMREDVYDILPFILTMANETFEAQKLNKLQTLPGRGSTDFSNFTEENVMVQRQGSRLTPDILRFLLPALCHLVAEDKSRKIIMDIKLHEVLYTYLTYHWSIFDSYKHWLEEQVAAEEDADVAEPCFMIDNGKFEMVNSKYAMTHICNILMNLTVLEPQYVDKTPIFFHILKFIMNTLPTLDNAGELLVLYGNFAVLGLLILKHHSRRPNSTDFSIFRFVQAVIRFLWDAHNCEETRDEEELTVSKAYAGHWNDLVDLWFLGMQVLSSVLREVPWIVDFILESGWSQEIVRTLGKVRKNGVDSSTKSAFEDLLCSLVRNSKDVNEELRKNGVIAVCQTHQLKELATLISSAGISKVEVPKK